MYIYIYIYITVYASMWCIVLALAPGLDLHTHRWKQFVYEVAHVSHHFTQHLPHTPCLTYIPAICSDTLMLHTLSCLACASHVFVMTTQFAMQYSVPTSYHIML